MTVIQASKLPGARRAALPKRISAQLATLVATAPAGEAWVHEIKLDGYRMLARIDQGQVQILSRNHHDWTARFASLLEPLRKLKVDTAVFDGEVVVLDNHGVSRFQLLQDALSSSPRRSGPMIYFLFDLLYLNGFDLSRAPLLERKRVLAAVLRAAGPKSRIRLSKHIVGDGPLIHAHACKAGLEGIISKRADAPYRAGRSTAWLKVKCRLQQELVIGGYTEPAGSRQGFGALLVGYYERGKLRYAGRVGTGFNTRLLRELAARLHQLKRHTSPFVDPPARERGVHWVKPELVGQFQFSNWTEEGLLRQAAFAGLREDKQAKAVRRELPR